MNVAELIEALKKVRQESDVFVMTERSCESVTAVLEDGLQHKVVLKHGWKE